MHTHWLLLLLSASPTDGLQSCAERAIAASPASERAQLTRRLHREPYVPSLDEQEQRAMSDRDRLYPLLLVAEDAARVGDHDRAVRIAVQMESDFQAKHPSYEMDVLEQESQLARAQAAAGHPDLAKEHLDAARAVLPKISDVVLGSAHRHILLAALMLHDETLAHTEEEAFFTAERAKLGSERPATDVLVAARDLAYIGEGRRALRYADEAKKLESPALAAYQHDRVLSAILEGVKSRQDLPLALDILSKMTAARERTLEFEQFTISLDDSQRRSAPVIAEARAVLALEGHSADIDDFARLDLVESLANVGLAKESVAVTSRIKNPYTRARAEATAARELALTDREGSLRLARAALARSKTPGARKDVDNDQLDIDDTRSAVISALARAGAVEEARQLGSPFDVDVAIGLHDRPNELANWWTKLQPISQAQVLGAAIRQSPGMDDGAFLVPLCRP